MFLPNEDIESHYYGVRLEERSEARRQGLSRENFEGARVILSPVCRHYLVERA